MKTHSSSSNPIEIGEINHASVDEEGHIVLLFGKASYVKGGVTFNTAESKIIINAIADYIAKFLFPEER